MWKKTKLNSKSQAALPEKINQNTIKRGIVKERRKNLIKMRNPVP